LDSKIRKKTGKRKGKTNLKLRLGLNASPRPIFFSSPTRARPIDQGAET
jgi:hypothetical protein